MVLNSNQKRLRRRYTRIAKFGKHYSAFLRIDHQEFCVVEGSEKRRANWFRDQLAIALERIAGQQ